LRDVGNSRTLTVCKPQGSIEISKSWQEAAVNFPHLAKNARYPDFQYAAPASVACAAFIKESRMK
jgi:hypothetical protein